MAEKRIGEILMEAGLIDEAQLNEALEDQKALGGRIGGILVDKCMLDGREYLLTLSFHLGVPTLDFTKVTIPGAVMRLIKKEMAWNYMILPVSVKETRSGKVLTLAMADPTDLRAIDAAEQGVKMKVEPVLALELEIRHILIDYYENNYGNGDYRLERAVQPVDCAGRDKAVYEPFAKFGSSSAAPSPSSAAASGAFLAPEDACACDDVIRELEEKLVGEYANFSRVLRALLKLLFAKGVVQREDLTEILGEMKAREKGGPV